MNDDKIRATEVTPRRSAVIRALRQIFLFSGKVILGIVSFFAVTFLALTLIMFWTDEAPPVPLLDTTMRWALYAFIFLIVVGSALIVLQAIYWIIGKMRGADDPYIPNVNELALLLHSSLAALWTGLTSAQGFKLITAPLSPWFSFDGVIAGLGGIMAGVLVFGYWSGVFSLLDRDADHSFPVAAEKGATDWTLEKEQFEKTTNPIEKLLYFIGSGFVWLWNGLKGRITDFTFFIAALLLFVIPVSTITTVIGVSGQDAIYTHVLQQYEVLESELDAVNDFRLEEDAIAQRLAGQARAYEGLATQAKDGFFSGEPGQGLLFQTFEASKEDFERFSADLRDVKEGYTASFKLLSERIAQNRTALGIAYQKRPDDGSYQKTIFELLDDQRVILAELRSEIIRLRKESQLPSMRGQIVANNSLYSLLPVEAEDGTVRENEQLLPQQMRTKLAANYTTRTRQIATLIDVLPGQNKEPLAIVASIDELLQGGEISVATFEDVSLLWAVWEYRYDIAITWFIALAIDFGLLLWAIWIARNGKLRLLKRPKYKPQIQP